MTQQVELVAAVSYSKDTAASILGVGHNNTTLHLMQYQKQERFRPQDGLLASLQTAEHHSNHSFDFGWIQVFVFLNARLHDLTCIHAPTNCTMLRSLQLFSTAISCLMSVCRCDLRACRVCSRSSLESLVYWDPSLNTLTATTCTPLSRPRYTCTRQFAGYLLVLMLRYRSEKDLV